MAPRAEAMSAELHLRQKIREQALALVVPQFKLTSSSTLHGIGHWEAVEANVAFLCRELNQPLTVPCWFAWLHDSQRFDEGSDPRHGERAADWARSLVKQDRIRLTLDETTLLVHAIAEHSKGYRSDNPIVGICWDADRLDLPRTGTQPNARYMSTVPGRGLSEPMMSRRRG